MKNICIIAIPVMLLAGCVKKDDPHKIEAGKWQISAGVTEFDVPGATPAQARIFQAAVGEKQKQEQCISQAGTNKGPQIMAEAFKQGGDCTVAKFETIDGKIDGAMSCEIPQTDGTAVMKIGGNFGKQTINMKMTANLVQKGLPGGKANVTMEITGKRLGDC